MRYRFLNILIILFLLSSLVIPIPNTHADSLLGLPEPGVMVNLSPAYEPMLIKGLKVHPENPFLFDFIIDTGSDNSVIASVAKQSLKDQSEKLIKYFLAAMTVPENDLWVNLSPYEKNRMIASNLAQTDMGRDMLAQDYILKQLTASLIYPEKNLGKIFWDEIYAKAHLLYGTTDIPVDTFNKVWIIPDKADVYEHGNTAYIVGAHLKVMLEEDYLALSKHHSQSSAVSPNISSTIVRQIILPQIEREVNKGRNFAPLRQMFYSMILASWYKIALKDAIVSQIYGDQSKVKVGINQLDPGINQEIFNRYLQAYKKGVFNYIKDTVLPDGVEVPRKYFSGGTNFAMLAEGGILNRYYDPVQIPSSDSLPGGNLWIAKTMVDPAMVAKRNHNFLRTVVWYSKSGNVNGIPEVRYTRISTLSVGPDHEKAFLKGIADNKDIILLTRDEVLKSRDGNTKIFLSNDIGIIPQKYLGQKVTLSSNVREILEGFNPNAEALSKSLKHAPAIAIRVNEVFRVIVHDRTGDRYLYFFPFNKKDLDNGKLKISSLGGGVQFLKGGLEYYKKKVDPTIRTIPGEDKDDVRVIISGNKLDDMLHELDKGNYIEKNGNRELHEELNGDNGLFPKGVPTDWLSLDAAMASAAARHALSQATNGGIDFNSDNMRMDIQGDSQGISMHFDPATIQRIKSRGFDGLEFRIQSIVPFTQLTF